MYSNIDSKEDMDMDVHDMVAVNDPESIEKDSVEQGQDESELVLLVGGGTESGKRLAYALDTCFSSCILITSFIPVTFFSRSLFRVSSAKTFVCALPSSIFK